MSQRVDSRVSPAALKIDNGGQFITDKLQEALLGKLEHEVKLPYLRNPRLLQHPQLSKFCFSELFDDIKKTVCKVHETSLKTLYFNKVVDNKTYELPDNQNIVVSREYYDIPENLFKSSEVGPPK